jgi:hypothetical protein
MEFFRTLAAACTAEKLQQGLTIGRLAQHCAEIDSVLSAAGEKGEIYCLWGQFRVHREVINGGVRFTLPDCPNALAWSVTTGLPPSPGSLVIHCTINRREHEPDFIESIEIFVDALQHGLRPYAVAESTRTAALDVTE